MRSNNHLSTHATTIAGNAAGRTDITYHATVIVSFDAGEVTLNSGGYRTATTLKKLNQAAIQFGLPYSIRQKDGAWTVWLVLRDEAIPFADGMKIARRV